jgi:hypothetical protein
VTDLTTEQADAYNALEAAVDRAGRVNDCLEDGEVLTTFAVIAACEHIERPGLTRYVTLYPGGRQPAHVVAGLFTVALDITNGGWTEADDD